jgi:hypothetical protein
MDPKQMGENTEIPVESITQLKQTLQSENQDMPTTKPEPSQQAVDIQSSDQKSTQLMASGVSAGDLLKVFGFLVLGSMTFSLVTINSFIPLPFGLVIGLVLLKFMSKKDMNIRLGALIFSFGVSLFVTYFLVRF